jgi:hypothetical protein
VKLGIKDHGAGFLVVDELILETVPYRAGRWMSCHGDLDQVGSDSAILPGVHGAIHVAPVGSVMTAGGTSVITWSESSYLLRVLRKRVFYRL